AGYRIYRSTNKNLPLAEWQNLTPELLTTNTFQDRQVESGKTYYYYLTAADKAGNISEPSEIVSETAP
ncbi:MAG: TolB protein, partial [Acidobacteriota bacterium]